MECEEESDEHNSAIDSNNGSDTNYVPYSEKVIVPPSLTSQSELNDLVTDLGLTEDGAEFLAAYFRSKHCLESGTKVEK